VTYGGGTVPGAVPAPNGSDAGRDALRDSVGGIFPDTHSDSGRGCIDIARSGADPRTVGASGDRSTFQYYAFALDGAIWASPSLQAPASMTLSQLRAVFGCSITDWSAIRGAGHGPIQRVMPPSGSDTARVFIGRVLGFDPSGITGASCPAVVTSAENDGIDPPLGTGDVYQQAIMPYSAGTWTYQAQNSANPTIDTRNGVRIGGITRVPGDQSTTAYAVAWNGFDFYPNAAVINEANPNLTTPTDVSVFPGVYYVYNVIDTTSPSYVTARGVVGYDPADATGSSRSALCSGTLSSTILSSGFLPLAAQTQNQGPTVTCRLRTP
jgi:ABC-type phosphate transport system substrate-binding protein